MEDKSQSKSSVAQLRASKEINKRIIEALPGGIVHVAIDGAIQTANPEALRILGLSFDELTGRYTQDFAPETIWEDGSPCLPEDYPVTRALVTGDAQPPATIGVRGPSGELSWSIFTAVPVKSADGSETTGAVVTFLDVTASKATELALRESKASLLSVVESAPSIIITTTPEGQILFVNRSIIPAFAVEDIIGQSIFDFVDPEQVHTVRSCMDTVLGTGEISGYEITGRSGVQGIEGKIYSVRVGPIKGEDKVVGLCFVATDVTEIGIDWHPGNRCCARNQQPSHLLTHVPRIGKPQWRSQQGCRRLEKFHRRRFRRRTANSQYCGRSSRFCTHEFRCATPGRLRSEPR
jgi:PAS domain S-box-containing protein